MNYQYIWFYKPYDVLCQFTDDNSSPRPTLKEYINIPDVYPVGRLDHDSEGLLFLTNHGWLQHRLTDPGFAHPRSYWVQVENIPTELALEQLRHGVKIQNYITRPAQVKLLTSEPNLPARQPPIRERKNIPTAWLEITLTEGKNRQIRRMTAAVGYPTLRLVRVAIAQLNIIDPTSQTTVLNPGEWQHLNDVQKHLLYDKWPNSERHHHKYKS
ncbi:MAG: pseudouridine synthase, partial [Microcoleaceae cyanobacterium]